jgi:hypothetical protein
MQVQIPSPMLRALRRLWRCLVLYGILAGCYWIVTVLRNLVFLFLLFAANRNSDLGFRGREPAGATPAYSNY